MAENTPPRSCASCLLHHPERVRKPCSCFTRCVTGGNCAAYIEDKRKTEVDKHVAF